MKKPCKPLHCGRRIKAHPITVAAFLYRYAFLLVIPILQYIIIRPQGIWEMLTAGGANVLLALSVIIYACLRYKCTDITLCGSKIIVRKGVFRRTKTVIFEKRLVGAAIRRSAVTLLFGAHTLSIIEDEGKPSVQEYIGRKGRDLPLFRVKGESKRLSLLHSFIAAADSTSALSGLLLIIPFLRKTAPVIGGRLSEGFYGSVDMLSNIVSRLLPPAVAYISGFIAAGYGFAFAYELFRHLRTRIVKNGEYIKISRGCVWRSVSVQARTEISAVTAEQGILCTVLGIKKLFLLSPLNRSAGSERELFEVKRGRLKRPDDSITVKPRAGSIFSFLLMPLCLLAAAVGFAFYFQSVGRDITVMIIMSTAVPFSLFLLLLRAASFEQSFLRIDENGVLLGSSSGLRLMRAYIEKSKVNAIEIRQNPLQRIFGSCNVRVYAHNRRKPFIVKKLNKKGLQTAALNLYEY
ncbi:MAG: PH domain-containing protein [Acutalibacteraceae bacterium]